MMLTQLLTQCQNLSPFYPSPFGDSFSNHLPMALIALNQLGASDQRLKEFYTHAAKRLLPVAKNNLHISEVNFHDYLGEEKAYFCYQNYFQNELNHLGRKNLLKIYLPKLSPGIAAHIFHPLIRIGYGLIANHDHEIIAGLAYFASHYLSLAPSPIKQAKSRKLEEALQLIRQQRDFQQIKLSKASMSTRIKEVAKMKAFAEVVNYLDVEQFDLAGFANRLLTWQQCENNAITLHAVTSCHALRLVLPYFNNNSQILRYYWHAIAALYIISKCPVINWQIDTKPENLKWDEIKLKAIQSNNEHIIKFVYTCWQEQTYYHQARYQIAATKMVTSS